MKYIFLIILLIFPLSLFGESWLEKNYDVNLTCKSEKFCNTQTGNCKFFNNTISFHFSLDTDINSYLKYRTCTKDSRGHECYLNYSDRSNKDGIWICQGAGCIKGIITSILPNEISAIDWPGLFEKDVNWDGTSDTEYGKTPRWDVLEYVFDRTKGTMIESWIYRCGGNGPCAGARIKPDWNFPLHEKHQENYYSCEIINKQF